jgi:hypothetical protein
MRGLFCFCRLLELARPFRLAEVGRRRYQARFGPDERSPGHAHAFRFHHGGRLGIVYRHYFGAASPHSVRRSSGTPAFTAAEAAAMVKQNIAAGADVLKLFTGSYVSRGHIKPMPLPRRPRRRCGGARQPPDRLRASIQSGRSPHRDGRGVDVLAHAPDTVDGVNDALLANWWCITCR